MHHIVSTAVVTDIYNYLCSRLIVLWLPTLTEFLLLEQGWLIGRLVYMRVYTVVIYLITLSVVHVASCLFDGMPADLHSTKSHILAVCCSGSLLVVIAML